jgi:3',5'-cyclic AMP phosphodiesterase CpdA
MPDLLVQLSDLHVHAADPASNERAVRAIELVRRLDVPPTAILLSGDLTNRGARDEYQQLVELLGPLLELGAPLLPMVGNHDDRALVRELLAPLDGVADMGTERHLQYVWTSGSLRVLVLDTQHTGHDDGKHCDTRHAWLVEQLEAEPATPTILAMHHPPVSSGLPSFAELELRADHAARFADLLGRHPQVELVCCGHIHRPFTSRVAASPVFACPSVFFPARPDLSADRPLALVEGPVGIGVHVRTAPHGSLASHVRMIGDVPTEQRVIEP